MKNLLRLLSILAMVLLFAGCCTKCNQPTAPEQATFQTMCASGNCSVAKKVKGPDAQMMKQHCKKSGKCAMKQKPCMCKQGGTCTCPAGKCQCKAPMMKKSCAKCEMKKQQMSCGAGKCGKGKCGGSK